MTFNMHTIKITLLAVGILLGHALQEHARNHAHDTATAIEAPEPHAAA